MFGSEQDSSSEVVMGCMAKEMLPGRSVRDVEDGDDGKEEE